MAKQNVQDRGAQIPRNAAQQRYWTFCEAIKVCRLQKNLPTVISSGSEKSLTNKIPRRCRSSE